ncbi:MAG: acyltransferase [Synoicihabitans sp.]
MIFLYPHLSPVQLGEWTFHWGYLGHFGYYGVELFFVLSGFLIGRILFRKGEDLSSSRELRRFWARRWFRTLPAYFLFLLLNLAVAIWVFPQKLKVPDVLGYVVFIQNFADYGVTFFGESWSLAVEEWFYLLFPLLGWLLLRAKLRGDQALLISGGLFYLFSTWYRWQLSADPQVQWTVEPRVVTIARFDAMMVGIFSAWMSLRHTGAFQRLRYPAAIVGMVILGAAYTTLFAPDEEQSRWFGSTLRFNLVSFGFACLLPWGRYLQTTGSVKLDAAIRSIACWSYAMYLSHMLVVQFITRRWLPDYAAEAWQGYLGLGLLWGLTIGISALVYRGFERPLTSLRDRFAFSRD